MAGPGKALVIGGGGGRDIYNALSSGQRAVDVIELNQGIVDVVDKDLKRVVGVALLPAARQHGRRRRALDPGRARHALRPDPHRLHRHAERELRDRVRADREQPLHRGGVRGVPRPPDARRHPERLAPVPAGRRRGAADHRPRAADARARGVRDPERHVVSIMSRDILGELFATMLVRPRPWTGAELARLKRLAADSDLKIAFAPGGPYELEWAQLAAAPSPQAFCERYRLDVCAADRRPAVLLQHEAARGPRRGAAARLPVRDRPVPGARDHARDPGRAVPRSRSCCRSLFVRTRGPADGRARSASSPRSALGFLLLEVVLIQRFVLFLGFPTYALSVVLFALLSSRGSARC